MSWGLIAWFATIGLVVRIFDHPPALPEHLRHRLGLCPRRSSRFQERKPTMTVALKSMADNRTGPIPACWRRLEQLGTPRQDVDYVLMNSIWRHGIVCRWDGRRWLTRAPYNRRGLDLETRLGSLPMPTWFLELPSLQGQVQAEIDQARTSTRDLLANLRTPLGTD